METGSDSLMGNNVLKDDVPNVVSGLLLSSEHDTVIP
jgi:hypothetical protein